MWSRCYQSAMTLQLVLAVCDGLTVRVWSSSMGSTFSLSFFPCIALLMGSLPLQTIVNTWQRFLKACTKCYVVNSCLAPPLNPDNEAVSHSATCSTNLLWASWGVVMLSTKEVKLVLNQNVSQASVKINWNTHLKMQETCIAPRMHYPNPDPNPNPNPNPNPDP